MLYLFVLAPILIACSFLLLPQRIVRWTSLVVYIGMFGFSLHLFSLTRFSGQVLTVTTGGPGILGITLYCDLMASIYLVLISFMFVCFHFYSAIRDRALKMFSVFLTILQTLLILIVLSRDLFNIFVALEVSTIVCSILIMFKKESRSIYDGLFYLMTNTLGMFFILMGIGFLYRQYGVLDITELTRLIAETPGKSLLLPYSFIMTGVCMKCALFPLHIWLPHAHGTPGAPTVVSAVLSGLNVKISLFLFIRMRAMFLPALDMDAFFLFLGVITAFAGILMAIRQKDIKLILAYHTVSQMGLIVFGLSLDNAFATAGATLHTINHALFKSLLFLASGILISKYGTRDVRHIRGVLRAFPLVGFAMISGILGITGAPLFNGSISKYFMQSGAERFWIEGLFILINFGTILSFVKFGQVLFGTPDRELTPNDLSSNAILSLLGILCLLTGVLGSPFLYLLFGEHFRIEPPEYLFKVALWGVSFVVARWIYLRHIHGDARPARFFSDVSFNQMGMRTVGFFVILFLAGRLL